MGRAEAASPVSVAPEKIIPFMRDKEILKAKTALSKIACRPVVISSSPPIPVGDSAGLGKELTIALGSYRFIRTDVGNPDGRLTVTRGGKEICIAETSILAGIRLVPNQDILILRFDSGSGRDWQVFQMGNIESGKPCMSLGLISNKEVDEFEAKVGSLNACK